MTFAISLFVGNRGHPHVRLISQIIPRSALMDLYQVVGPIIVLLTYVGKSLFVYPNTCGD